MDVLSLIVIVSSKEGDNQTHHEYCLFVAGFNLTGVNVL